MLGVRAASFAEMLVLAAVYQAVCGSSFRHNPHYDVWPTNLENVQQMFQSMEEHEEQVQLTSFGRIPRWLKGTRMILHRCVGGSLPLVIL